MKRSCTAVGSMARQASTDQCSALFVSWLLVKTVLVDPILVGLGEFTTHFRLPILVGIGMFTGGKGF